MTNIIRAGMLMMAVLVRISVPEYPPGQVKPDLHTHIRVESNTDAPLLDCPGMAIRNTLRREAGAGRKYERETDV
jgi:hypothetical protein